MPWAVQKTTYLITRSQPPRLTAGIYQGELAWTEYGVQQDAGTA